MKPLTMSEEQEAEDREALVSNNWWALGSGAHQNIADRAWDEIDALRARVAEVEAQQVETRRHNAELGLLASDKVLEAIQAQAEARELREALKAAWPTLHYYGHKPGEQHVNASPSRQAVADALSLARAALSRPPGDDTALREMLVEALGRALNEAWKHDMPINKEALESIINRILGQPGDDAAPTKEDQMPESREMTLTEKQVVDLAAVVFGKSVEKDPVIEDIFTYHAPEGDQAARYQLIREAAKQFAYTIHCLCEPGPDRTTAIRKVREATMTANQSIATKNAQYR